MDDTVQRERGAAEHYQRQYRPKPLDEGEEPDRAERAEHRSLDDRAACERACNDGSKAEPNAFRGIHRMSPSRIPTDTRAGCCEAQAPSLAAPHREWQRDRCRLRRRYLPDMS